MKLQQNIILLIVLINLIFLSFSFAQVDAKSEIDQSQIIFKDGSKFKFGGEEYKFEEMTFILKSYPEFSEYYHKAIKSRTMERNSMLTFITSGALTAGFVIGINSNNYQKSGGLMYYFWASIYGTISLVSFPIYLINAASRYSYIKNTLNFYNEAELERKGYKKSKGYISLGLTSNGVGLSYHF